MADAVRLAQRMHDSRMFSGYGLAQAVLSTILLGRELGMPAMASLRSVHLIKGKHCLSADLMVALVLRSGKADYFRMIESTEALSTFETQRKGDPEPTSITYTIEQATQADLVKPNGNWHEAQAADAPRQGQVGTRTPGLPGPARRPLHAGGAGGRMNRHPKRIYLGHRDMVKNDGPHRAVGWKTLGCIDRYSRVKAHSWLYLAGS